jgi:SAM-dependent methyltransferase
VSPNPFSAAIVAAMRAGVGIPDAVRGRLRDGDRHLELGCGVAGRILCVLQAFPTLTAVGVEQTPDLAAEAERRAVALGVADRFEVVCADAATTRLDGAFDIAFWSQFFFPQVSRAGTLATAYDALRPGGMLLAPLLGDPSVARSEPHGTSARGLALARVVHGLWGVPDRSPDELVTEVAAAGFVDVAVSAAPDAGVLVVVGTVP